MSLEWWKRSCHGDAPRWVRWPLRCWRRRCRRRTGRRSSTCWTTWCSVLTSPSSLTQHERRQKKGELVGSWSIVNELSIHRWQRNRSNVLMSSRFQQLRWSMSPTKRINWVNGRCWLLIKMRDCIGGFIHEMVAILRDSLASIQDFFSCLTTLVVFFSGIWGRSWAIPGSFLIFQKDFQGFCSVSEDLKDFVRIFHGFLGRFWIFGSLENLFNIISGSLSAVQQLWWDFTGSGEGSG